VRQSALRLRVPTGRLVQPSAGGSLVADFPDRVAFFPVLTALGATSGDCAPTMATVEVVFCMVSGLRWKSGEGLSTSRDSMVAPRRSVKVWRPIETLTPPRSTGVTFAGAGFLRGS
jgi:hypothetical protein